MRKLARVKELSLLVATVLVCLCTTAAGARGSAGAARESRPDELPQSAGAPTAAPQSSSALPAPGTQPNTTKTGGPASAGQTSSWGWDMPGVDEVRLTLAQGVECPQPRVIEGAGQRLKELVDNISRFDAVEEIIHEEQNPRGKVLASVKRKYAYVVAVKSLPADSPVPGLPLIDESRLSDSGLSDSLGGIRTTGLPTLALVFHPAMRDTFELACEGLGEWQGQPAWLMHFRQRSDRPNYLQQYKIGDNVYPVALKGRAWVDATNFQIVHMEAELVQALPEIKLLTEHYIVDYGMVTFQKKNAELWLPKRAELYFHFRGRRYYRLHSFDNFRLFSVDSTQKVTVPKTENAPPGR